VYDGHSDTWRKESLQQMLRAPFGLDFLVMLVQESGMLNNPLRMDGATEYNCGRMAVGQALIAKLMTIDEKALIKILEQEVRRNVRRD